MAKRSTLRCSATCAVLLLGGLVVLVSHVQADSLVANAAPEVSSSGVVNPPEKDTKSNRADAQVLADNAVTKDNAAFGSLETQAIKRNRPQSDVPANSQPAPSANNAIPSKERAVAALVAVLGLIALTVFIFRYFAQRQRLTPGGRAIHVVARMGIGPKQSLCLVKLADRILLVGLSPNHMATLDTINDPEQVARLLGQVEKGRPDSISASFDKVFAKETGEYHDEAGAHDVEETPLVDSHGQWHRARHEVTSLLDKVKGLSRLRFRT